MTVVIFLSRHYLPALLAICAVIGVVSSLRSEDTKRTAVASTEPKRSAIPATEPQYNDQGELKLPTDFQTWVFVGANLGIEYGDDSNQPAKKVGKKKEAEKKDTEKKAPESRAKTGNFHNVYINPEAYAEYLKSGKFPEKTVLVLDVYKAEAGDADSIVSEGLFPGKQAGIAVAVKNSARPDGSKTDWAYYDFPLGKSTAKAFADKACYDCHLHHADDDNVFVQFYPTLLRLKKK